MDWQTLKRECVLSSDEMAITPSVELHMLTGKLYGDVTLPGHTGVATHACVFMLAGNNTVETSSGISLQWQFYQWSRV